MKKLCLLLSLLLCFSFSACVDHGNYSNDAGHTLQVLWDGGILLTDFEFIQENIDQYKADLESGVVEDIPINRVKVANTELVRDFAAENDFNIEALSWGWGDPLTQKLSASFLTGDGPDIINGETQLPRFAQAGNLEPFPEELETFLRENVSPIAYRDMEFDGKIYGVALQPTIAVLVWNKDILRQAGIEDVDTAPATFEELEANMKQVYDRLNGERIYAGGAYGGANNGGYLRSTAIINAFGGSIVDENGAPSLNNPDNVAAFEFMRRVSTYNTDGVLNASGEHIYHNAFLQGRIAYKVDGLWALTEMPRQGLDCGFSLLPEGPNGSDGNILIGATYLAVPTYSDEKELAFKLIKFLLGESIQQNIADVGQRTPVLNSVLQSEEYKEEYPLLYEFATYASERDITGLPPYKGNVSEVWKAYGQALGKTLEKSQSMPITGADGILETYQTEMMKDYNAK